MKFELKLVDILLKNFRLFDEVKINFDDKLTVFIGENGAGKTALLEGISKAMNAVILRLRKNTTDLDPTQFYEQTDIKYGKNAILTDINLQQIFEDEAGENAKKRAEALNDIENKRKERFDLSNEKLKNSKDEDEAETFRSDIERLDLEVNAQIKSIEEEFGVMIKPDNNIRYRLQPTLRIDTQVKDTDSEESFGEENIAIIAEIARKIDEHRREKKEFSLPAIVYYPCERINADSKNGLEKRYGMDVFNAYDHALDGLSLNYKRFLAWYEWRDRNKDTRILDNVNEAMLGILNDVNDTPFKNIYIDPSDFEDYKLIIQKGEDKVEVNQLSSGEKSLLLLVSNLAYRLALLNPDSKNPLEEGQGIVLIDEIDMHLHPRWQRAVIPKLLKIFPKIQWVITTHSPQVLGEIEHGKIYILDNKKVRPLNFNTYGKDMNRILEHIMGVSERNEVVTKEFEHYFELIELNELEEAKILRSKIEEEIGTDEPLFRRADGILKRKQLIGR